MVSSVLRVALATAFVLAPVVKADFSVVLYDELNQYCSGDTGHCSNNPMFRGYMPSSTNIGTTCPDNDVATVTGSGEDPTLAWPSGFCGYDSGITCTYSDANAMYICSADNGDWGLSCTSANADAFNTCAVPSGDATEDSYEYFFTCSGVSEVNC